MGAKYFKKIGQYTRKVSKNAVNDDAKYFKRIDGHTRSVPKEKESTLDRMKRYLR